MAYKYGLFHHHVNPSLPLLSFAAALSSSPNWLGFLHACYTNHHKISMVDTRIVDLDIAVIVEKHGRGHPCGSVTSQNLNKFKMHAFIHIIMSLHEKILNISHNVYLTKTFPFVSIMMIRLKRI
jgi:hypothetical protein